MKSKERRRTAEECTDVLDAASTDATQLFAASVEQQCRFSFPLNCRWWLARNIINTAIDSFDLVDDAARNAC